MNEIARSTPASTWRSMDQARERAEARTDAARATTRRYGPGTNELIARQNAPKQDDGGGVTGWLSRRGGDLASAARWSADKVEGPANEAVKHTLRNIPVIGAAEALLQNPRIGTRIGSGIERVTAPVDRALGRAQSWTSSNINRTPTEKVSAFVINSLIDIPKSFNAVAHERARLAQGKEGASYLTVAGRAGIAAVNVAPIPATRVAAPLVRAAVQTRRMRHGDEAVQAAQSAKPSPAAARPDADARVRELVGPGMTPNEARFAERVELEHVFKGNRNGGGGMHHAPGPGRYGDTTVTRLNGSGKPVAEDAAPLAPDKTWRAKVEIRDETGAVVKTKESNMFPPGWSRAEVARALRHVAVTGRREARTTGSGVWDETGRLDSVIGEYRGIRIKVFLNPASQRHVYSGAPMKSNATATP